ncbi:MAG: CHAT domain-containing protein [Proteobacteria bacterium]|nr:CHAT domain-containing protein [Pseudomonadota bacterium]
MGRILLILSLIVATLQSCVTTTTMSLEEAKRVTISMMGEDTFVPPPRRVEDITAILNQPGKSTSGSTDYYKSKAAAAPPANETEQGQADFYKNRSIAAYELGRSKQTLEDGKMAEHYAGKAGITDPIFIQKFATAEREAGNFRRAIQLYEQNIKASNYIWSYAFLAFTYASIGDIEAASRIKEDGIRNCREGKRGAALCQIIKAHMEAAILEAQGKYREAEPYIRDSLDRALGAQFNFYTPGGVLRWKTWLARNLFFQGRFFESEIAARDVLNESLGHGGQESAQTFFAVFIISLDLAAQGRILEAERLLSSAIKTLEASGVTNDSLLAAQARSGYGNLLTASGNYRRAMEQFDLVKTGMQENQYLYDKSFTKNPALLLSLLMTGRTGEATGIISDNYEKFRNVFGEKDFNTAEMLALRGMAHFRQGNLKQAREDFSNSINILTQYVADRGGYIRSQRVKIIIQDYMRLLDRVRETDPAIDTIGLSFQLAEITRGQTVQSAVMASSARAAETDPEVINLIRQEQDTLKQISVTETSILEIISASPDQQNPQLIKSLHAKLDALRQARGILIDEIKKRSKKYAEFVNPQTPLPATVQKHLRPHESLISIYTLDDRTYIWAIPQSGNIRFASVPVLKTDLDEIVSALRKSLDPNPSSFSDIPLFDTNLAHELFSTFFLPVRDGWKDAHDILVIVNEPISQIPLATLTTEPFKQPKEEKLLFDGYRNVPWLIRQVSITMVPSASSLISLRMLPAGPIQRKAFAGFGDPIFNPGQVAMSEKQTPSNEATIQVRSVRLSNRGGLDSSKLISSQIENLERLPDTAEEIKAIAVALKADMPRDVFLGKEASENRVKTMDLSDRQVIAFATHALVPGDLDGLDQPALALSSPKVTGINDDGLLTMGEIMKLKLNADWVVLSACNTGAAAGSGAEALSGLGKAFFYAGTRAVIATMYPVETTSAKKLTTQLFQNQIENREYTRSQALQKAMLNLIKDPGYIDPISQKIVASYAHPLFWAPFVLFGDGGRED